ncbi:hypothetical protein SESBI_07732 [Sesbania bispinosa]|nr:hypothetical protein SESBI_07732 [Sesbania bispinosa]
MDTNAVEVLAANHLRFVEEPKPPDLEKNHMSEEEDEGNSEDDMDVVSGEEESDDEEMVQDTSQREPT